MDKNGNFKWYGRVSDEQWEALKRKRSKQRLYKSSLKYKYLIGKSFDKKIIEIVGRYEHEEDVVNMKNMFKSWNESCVLSEAPTIKREWIIMKRPDDINEFDNVTYLTDDMGKTVRVKLWSKRWELIERIPQYVDRTFALLGDKRKQPLRYSFDEACETFIDVRLHEAKRLLPIYRLKNKIVFYYDREPIKALVCMTINEAEYFCYYLHQRYKNNSNVLIFNTITKQKQDNLIDELVQVTGVDRKRVADFRTNGMPRKKKNG